MRDSHCSHTWITIKLTHAWTYLVAYCNQNQTWFITKVVLKMYPYVIIPMAIVTQHPA